MKKARTIFEKMQHVAIDIFGFEGYTASVSLIQEGGSV
jgi:hypothetical protein